MQETKRCTRCGKIKPVNEFYKKGEGKLRSKCIECYKQDAANYRKTHLTRKFINNDKRKYTDYEYFLNKSGKYCYLRYIKFTNYKYDNGQLLKQCPICKNYFPAEEYKTNQGTKHYCKKCGSLPVEERRKYNIKHVEKKQSNFDPFKLIDNERFELNLKSILAFVSHLKKSQREEV